jgi:hypothetical protein
MRTVAGRRLLRDLVRDHGFFASTFDPNPLAQSFKEGRRAVAVEIFNAAVLISPVYAEQLAKTDPVEEPEGSDTE